MILLTIDFTSDIFLLLLGGGAGIVLKWFLNERNEKYELRRSIAPMRVDAYQKLWVLCRQDNIEMEKKERITALEQWYHDGGGLFLSLAASNRFFSILKLLKLSELPAKELKLLKENLTWLRTEMKYHVGSYTRKEAHTQIPDAR